MRVRLPVLLVVALCAAGCPRETTVPSGEVASSLPSRLELRRLTEPLGTGDLWEGREGDWLLGNERMAVVVRDIGRRGGFALNGGDIVDAVPEGGADQIREIFPIFNDSFPRQAIYESLDPETVPDSVVLVARGHDSTDPSLLVVTRYAIGRGARVLRIVTTVTNTGTQTYEDFELGDAIQWGRALPYAPGRGRELAGSVDTVPYLAASADNVAYGWASPEGDLRGPHGGAWSDPIVKSVALSPGESASYERWLLVSLGSEADVGRWARPLRGDATGTLRVQVRDADGESLAEAEVEAWDAGGRSAALGRTGAKGEVILEAPPGLLTLVARHPQHGAAPGESMQLEVGREKRVTLELPRPCRVHFLSVDTDGRPSPAKWTLEGVQGTADPPFLGERASGSGRSIFTGSGEAVAQVPAGHYRVTASRGPFYEIWQTEVRLSPEKDEAITATLSRLPVPADWVSADFHVHAVPSVDSNVSREDRLTSAAAEGIDWFAATDHGTRSDYDEALRKTALAAPVRILPGEEITTAHFGHFSGYPLQARSGPGKGALDETRLNPEAIFRALRDEGSDVIVQVNHPRTGRDGFLDLVGFRPENPARETIALDFDAIEVWSGRQHEEPDAVWADWMALLRSGRRVTALGNSDSHRLTGEEIGYPRNVLLPREDGVEWTVSEVARAVREGRVVVTNGPLVRLHVRGEGIGSTVSATSGVIPVRVTVWAASWVDVRRIILYVNGEVEARFPVAAGGGVLRFDEDIEVPLRQSAFILARVEGDAPLDPVVPARLRRGRNEPWHPLAVTNPIWVEIPGTSR